ncbi:hypothetical protein [Beijerinckia sp. L45]|uniref:hypothetical protein n=1 Tax=Beijerinckia sp. L45 TaxID=1641855 RepID=UPI00131AAAC3|nr:hypothetical protein [Beijerinckia sp. L45]
MTPVVEGADVPPRDATAADAPAAKGVAGRHAAIAIFCIPALWIAATTFIGIDGDARIYMGRAMADLDPGGVGRDIMFAQDGQAGFSIFRLVAARAVGWLGPKDAALVLAFCDMAAWFTAMVAFAGQFARGRARGVLVVCAAVLPVTYGFYPLLQAREIVAVPRPLSEACVLLALAALCRGRTALSLACLAAAALMHPIMALPGIAVVFLVLGLRDRRWLAAIAIGLIATIAAALAGVPFFARLGVVIDPPWRGLLDGRNPYLFVTHWPATSVAPLSVQCATVAVAALICQGRQRAIFMVALLVALSGVAVSWLLGDVLSLLLVVQAQPWRALWLIAVLAMPAFGLCALDLPRRGPLGTLALVFLGLAWITFDIMPLTPLAAIMALMLVLASRMRHTALSPVVVPAVSGIVAVLAVCLKWQEARGALSYIQSAPGPTDIVGPLWRLGLLPLVFIGLALAWHRWPRWRFEPFAASLVLATLIGLVATTWDRRSAATRRIEADVHDPTLVALTASVPGEVLWLANDDEWYWLGRPEWNGIIQGAGTVFSRPLAMTWRERTSFLVAQGLIDQGRLHAWRAPATIIVPTLTAPVLAALCVRQDAPAWVVAPLLAGQAIPAGIDGTIWHAPVAETLAGSVDDKPVWYAYDRYAVVPCRTGTRPPV